MAYCRLGEDSDVYLFGDGKRLNLFVRANVSANVSANTTPKTWGEWVTHTKPWDHPEAGRAYLLNSRTEMLDLLARLAETGVRVPERALARLSRERVDYGDAYPNTDAPRIVSENPIQDPEEDW